MYSCVSGMLATTWIIVVVALRFLGCGLVVGSLFCMFIQVTVVSHAMCPKYEYICTLISHIHVKEVGRSAENPQQKTSLQSAIARSSSPT